MWDEYAEEPLPPPVTIVGVMHPTGVVAFVSAVEATAMGAVMCEDGFARVPGAKVPEPPPPEPEWGSQDGEEPIIDGVHLSPDQRRAVRALRDAIEAHDGEEPVAFTLVGPAGSGKSTIVRELVRLLRRDRKPVGFVAPTGKAASRLSEVSGEMVTTIHQRIYGLPVEVKVCPKCGASHSWLQLDLHALKIRCQVEGLGEAVEYRCHERVMGENGAPDTVKGCGTIFLPKDARFATKLVFSRKGGDGEDPPSPEWVFVDEASMVDTKIHKDLMADPGTRGLIYVGDKNQLPPVEGPWGPDFEHPTAALTQIHRQAAGNPILAYSAKIAGDIGRGLIAWPTDFKTAQPPRLTVERNASMDVAATWLAQQTRARRKATLVTWRNEDRHRLNKLVRTRLGLDDRDNPIKAGDRLLARARCGSYLNGEVAEVLAAVWLEKPIGVQSGDRQLLYHAMRVTLTHPRDPGGKPVDVVVVPDFLEDKDLYRFRELTTAMSREMDHTSKAWVMGSQAGASLRAQYKDMAAAQTARVGGVGPDDLLFAHYGWCLTCHSSQGSQWPSVGVVLPWSFKTWAWKKAPGKDPATGKESDLDRDWARRWLYTAVTRAEDTLAIFELPKPPPKE